MENTTEDILIDRPTAADAQEILDLMKVIGGETDNLTFDGRGFYNTTVAEEAKLLDEKAKSDREAFFVVRKDARIVGMGHYTACTKERMAHRGTIGICLRKSACGQGLGTALMERLLDFARNTAMSEIVSLEVRCDNSGALHLYEKLGFENIGTFKGFFKVNGKLVDFYIMEKFL
ncbi:MAG: GNAT family N-acetyltransferase [Treponema sp.]|nr:GNAT family N-acetyltransferase [Treponema sp.]